MDVERIRWDLPSDINRRMEEAYSVLEEHTHGKKGMQNIENKYGKLERTFQKFDAFFSQHPDDNVKRNYAFIAKPSLEIMQELRRIMPLMERPDREREKILNLIAELWAYSKTLERVYVNLRVD